jgi:HD-GYP domain-containing protein (c-di-GMP phosphodiesterase class II)
MPHPIRLRLFLRELFRRAPAPEHYLDRLLARCHPGLAAHTARTRELTVRLAHGLAWATEDVRQVALGATLHDLGKVLLPPALLLSNRALSEVERQLVRRHPLLAIHLLIDVDLPALTFDAVAHHHERWDGTGYPFGLAGSRIPASARLLTIADVYDTLTHDRPYAPTYRPAAALAILRAEAGSHFDPDLLGQVLDLLATGPLDDTAGFPSLPGLSGGTR